MNVPARGVASSMVVGDIRPARERIRTLSDYSRDNYNLSARCTVCTANQSSRRNVGLLEDDDRVEGFTTVRAAWMPENNPCRRVLGVLILLMSSVRVPVRRALVS